MIGATAVPAPTPYSDTAVFQYWLCPIAFMNGGICAAYVSFGKMIGTKTGFARTWPPLLWTCGTSGTKEG